MKNKKMTSITMLAVLVISSSQVLAQSPTPNKNSKNKNVLSINPVSTINSFWYPVNNQQNEYIAVYHRIIGKANGIRLGVDGSSRKYNSNEQDTLTSTSSYKSFKIGVGIERYFYLTKTWNYFVGLDYQLENLKNDYSYKKSIQQESNSKSNINGGYLFFGILANLNSKLSISMTNGVKYSETKSNTNSQRKVNGVWVPENNVNDQSTVDYVNPTLQLRFRF